jgi:hypothetical protein
MSYSYPGTPDKGAGYMVDEFASAHGVAPASVNLDSMKAFARGILKALSEDEDGFNVNPTTAAQGAVNAASGNYISSDSGGYILVSDYATVNATNGTVDFSGNGLAGISSITVTPIGATNGDKVRITAYTTTTFSWDTSDGSTFNGQLHYSIRGVG